MHCRSCSTVNPRGNRFCENCGQQLQLTCARCGHDVGLSAHFCGNCGEAVNAGSAAVPVPKWGELKQATVLFADIVGSTEIVAHLDPEEAMGRLRPAVLRMRHSVERFGGTVVRTLGDGVMALFGVPHALEGHALLACEAALHMQRAFRRGGDGLSIRVGLHSGEVASDPEDAQDGRGGGAHGLTIHLASRVIALASPGGICLTPHVLALAGPGCETVSFGPHRLKGIPEPVEILGLTGIAASRRYAYAGLRPASTFRGRLREFAVLAGALEGGEPPGPNVIGLAGEPGTGKSRLCLEFADVCRQRGIPVLDVRVQLYGHALPLQPVLELFRTHFFGIGPDDEASAARALIADRFRPLAPAADDLGLLFEFFGVAERDAPASALGPRARQARLVGLLQALVRLDGGQQRVILIEDLQWLDGASEAFVTAIAEAVAGTRTLLLLNHRPAFRGPWERFTHFQPLVLGELPPTDMDALVAELLDPLTADPEVRALVCARAAGNPFFAEELVSTLAESKLFTSRSGKPDGGMQAVERALPATVQAVVGARLDRLGEPEKTYLQMCAIIGKEIPLAVLQQVAHPVAGQIEQGLDGLCQAGLIVPQPSAGGGSFAFRHPLIQEVAYTTQLRVRRGLVHASVAAAMEVYYAGQLDEYAGLIAYHFEAAHKPHEAARYMARAAVWASSTDAARAIQAWRKTRALLEGVPSSQERDALDAMACSKIVLLSWREGVPLHEVNQQLEAGMALARKSDTRLTQLLLFLDGRLQHANGGAADFYVARVHEALALTDPADAGRRATLHAALGQAHAWAGNLQQGVQACDVALAGIGAIDAYDREFLGFSIEGWMRGVKARMLVRLGRPQEAMAELRQMEDSQAASPDPVLRQMPHYGFVDLGYWYGMPDLAREHARRALQVAEAGRSPYLRMVGLYCGATAHLAAGAFGEAMQGFMAALDVVRGANVAIEFEGEILSGLAECYHAAGDTGSAVETAREALAIAQGRSHRLVACRALATLAGALALDPDAADEAAQHLAQAEALIASTGATVFTEALARSRAGLEQALQG